MSAAGTLKRALWVFFCNTGSCNGCDIENVAMVTPRYDVERFGIKVVGSPRHADVLVVTGPVTRKMAPRLQRVYEQMPEPRLVVAVGACAVSHPVVQIDVIWTLNKQTRHPNKNLHTFSFYINVLLNAFNNLF